MISQINKGGGSAPPFFNDAIRSSSYISGKYYPPSVNFNTFDFDRLVANSIQYVPFVPFRSYTFKGFCFYNSSTADSGANIRLAIYYDNGSGKPGNAYGLPSGGVTLDGTTALREQTLSMALVAGSIYWLAILSDTNPELLCFANNSNPGGTSLFAPTFGLDELTLGSTLVNSMPVGFLEARAYTSGMPATANPNTVMTAADTAATIICLKA